MPDKFTKEAEMNKAKWHKRYKQALIDMGVDKKFAQELLNGKQVSDEETIIYL